MSPPAHKWHADGRRQRPNHHPQHSHQFRGGGGRYNDGAKSSPGGGGFFGKASPSTGHHDFDRRTLSSAASWESPMRRRAAWSGYGGESGDGGGGSHPDNDDGGGRKNISGRQHCADVERLNRPGEYGSNRTGDGERGGGGGRRRWDAEVSFRRETEGERGGQLGRGSGSPQKIFSCDVEMQRRRNVNKNFEQRNYRHHAINRPFYEDENNNGDKVLSAHSRHEVAEDKPKAQMQRHASNEVHVSSVQPPHSNGFDDRYADGGVSQHHDEWGANRQKRRRMNHDCSQYQKEEEVGKNSHHRAHDPPIPQISQRMTSQNATYHENGDGRGGGSDRSWDNSNRGNQSSAPWVQNNGGNAQNEKKSKVDDWRNKDFSGDKTGGRQQQWGDRSNYHRNGTANWAKGSNDDDNLNKNTNKILSERNKESCHRDDGEVNNKNDTRIANRGTTYDTKRSAQRDNEKLRNSIMSRLILSAKRPCTKNAVASSSSASQLITTTVTKSPQLLTKTVTKSPPSLSKTTPHCRRLLYESEDEPAVDIFDDELSSSNSESNMPVEPSSCSPSAVKENSNSPKKCPSDYATVGGSSNEPPLPLPPTFVVPMPPDVSIVSEVIWAEDEMPSSSQVQFYKEKGWRCTRPPETKSERCNCRYEKDATGVKDETGEWRMMCCVDHRCVLFACQEECGPNCPAGNKCGNQRISRKQTKPLQVFDAGPKGLGVRTLVPIKKHEYIAEYVGVAIKRRKIDSLFSRYSSERMLYIMTLDRRSYIDARFVGGITRFINHSCDPNCMVERWMVRGRMRAGVFALRDIETGEELGFDYQWEKHPRRPATKCYCGMAICRGTLEMKRDDDELEEEHESLTLVEEEEGRRMDPAELEGVWKFADSRAGPELVDRTVRVYYEEEHQYYVAKVVGYDPKTCLHQVVYRGGEENEVTEDFAKLGGYQILDENASRMVIRRKKKRENLKNGGSGGSVDPMVVRRNKDQENLKVHGSGGSVASSPSISENGSQMNVPSFPKKNELYKLIQTPIKNELDKNKSIIRKCQEHYRVQINVHQCRDDGNGNIAGGLCDDHRDEETSYYRDLRKALDVSKDGTVWKLSITGYNLRQALTFLDTSIDEIQRIQASIPMVVESFKRIRPGDMILPKGVVLDRFKNQLARIQKQCRAVNFSWDINENVGAGGMVPSRLLGCGDTGSSGPNKQVERLAVRAELESDLRKAQSLLWKVALDICEKTGHPKSAGGCYINLGFHCKSISSSRLKNVYRIPCNKVFVSDIEHSQQCYIYIQTEEDAKRYATKKQQQQRKLHGDSHLYREIFIGCAPNRLEEVRQWISTRVRDLEKGIRFIPSGIHKHLMTSIELRFCDFFEYIQRVTGMVVTFDTLTYPELKYLRVEPGGEYTQESFEMVENLIKVQAMLLKPRRSSQCFGQDNWSSSIPLLNNYDINRPRSMEESFVATACLEVMSLNNTLNFPQCVVVHAIIIFYRYFSQINKNQCSKNSSVFNSSQQMQRHKARDAMLACLYIANKAQKIVKWKKLDVILEVAYISFFPNMKREPESNETSVWAKKVLSLEESILPSINFDICWPGIDHLLDRAISSGKFECSFVNRAMEISLSGPIVAAGPVLWLKYGLDCIFPAVICLIDRGFISRVCRCFLLHKAKLEMTAKLIVHALNHNELKKFKEHSKIVSKKDYFLASLRAIQGTQSDEISMCSSLMDGYKRSNMREIRGIDRTFFQSAIFPELNKSPLFTACRIDIRQSLNPNEIDLVLEGNPKVIHVAFAILEHIIKDSKQQCTLSIPSARSDIVKNVCNSIEDLLQESQVTRVALVSDIKFQPSDEKNGSEIMKNNAITCSIKLKQLRKMDIDFWVPMMHRLYSSKAVQNTYEVKMSILDNTHRQMAKHVIATLLGNDKNKEDTLVDITLVKWPIEKTQRKENRQWSKPDKPGFEMGFSASALQEINILYRLQHSMQSPYGHPNFILPLAVVTYDPKISYRKGNGLDKHDIPASALSPIRRTFQFGQSYAATPQDEKDHSKTKKPQLNAYLLIEHTPFCLTDLFVTSKANTRASDLITYAVFHSIFHDLLSAVAYAHKNHLLLRILDTDHILLDHAGVAKFCGVTMFSSIPFSERGVKINPLKHVAKRGLDDHLKHEQFMAPELLLGGNKYSKESDIWSLGCLLSHLLLQKSLFGSRDRIEQLKAIFKIVGEPSKNNYPDAKFFPNYKKTRMEKRYKRGVEKALRQMLLKKNRGLQSSSLEEYDSVINLISQMLHLDPKQRITAQEALDHTCLHQIWQDFEKWGKKKNYGKEWLILREFLSSK